MTLDRPDLASSQSLEPLQLSLKAYGFLRRSQIHSIADLLDYTQEDLLILDEEVGQEIITALEQKFAITLSPK
ncbi:hypothetical protein BST81_11180 [Leptolyngbya sp. 'hensonii']|uniref:DNA-directed RNA polymerase subunit alpha C-terminal domain-containing protein n=1 Tax=Leptolyngbya sp. 'hensonii' TaxID=1922337 RepID=UPI00094FE7D6|nr:DNA-directed RNA polymerase subunit alpha C-terminal domain-containing protein [Leptolyngbya sp. 'hensonii']OLP18350.1 hypothetical protein BST81_11180 [Leptolyngbya sp. 'hensonii']